MRKRHRTLTATRQQEHKTKQPALSPQGDFCKTRKDSEYCITKLGSNTNPPQTMEATINNESTTTGPTPSNGQ